MKNECIAAVERAAGRALTKGELDGIEARIRTSLRDLSIKDSDGFLAMPPAERVVEAAKLAKERMMEDVVKAHEAEIRNASIRAGLDEFRNSFQAGKSGRLLAAVQRFFYDAGSRAGDTSVEMNRKAIMGDFMRRLSSAHGADAGRFFGAMQDVSKRNAIIKELAGESSGDADAAKIAKAFQATNELAGQRAERAGIGFHELDNWRSPQSADWVKVAADKDQWLNDHLNWVDRRAYVNADGTRMSDDQLKTFLENVWETQATNGARKRADAEGSGGGSGLGTSRNNPRQLHYKDADSFTQAMDKYGRATNVYSMFMQHFNGLARDISISETLGRDASTNFKYLVEHSFADDVQAAKSDKERKELDALRQKAYRMYDVLSKGEGVGNQVWAQRMAAMRSVISSSMLGGLFGALPDFAMTSLTAKMNGMSQLRSMGQALKSTVSKADGEMLERLGLAVEGMQSAAHRFGVEEIGTGAPALLNEAVHKLSLLSAFDRGQRSGVALSMMDLLGKLSRSKTLADLQGGDHDFLVNSKGVSETNWAVWQAADVDGGPNGNRTLLTPDGIYAIPDAAMRPIVQDAIAKRSPVYEAELARIKERRAQELGWLDSRTAKLGELRQKAADIIGRYAGTRTKNLAELRDAIDARAEVTRARIEAAEVEHDIAGYLKTEKAQGRIGAFLQAVEDGASVERKVVRQRVHADNMTDAVVENFQKTPSIGERASAAVENYGRSINSAAEALGARRARAEERVAAAEKRYAELTKTAEKEVAAKVADYEKKIGKFEGDLLKMATDMQDRFTRYGEYEKAFETKFGKIEGEEIERAKSDAVTKLLASTLSEIQAGARGASGSSVMEKVNMGLDKAQAGTALGEIYRMGLLMKQTPLGIAYTHLFQRPAALDGWKSQWMYRAQFVAYSTMLGALATQLKSMASGQNPEQMNDPAFWGKAVTAGGGFGIYGDLLFADSAHTTNGIAGLIGGPGLSMAEDALRIYQSAKKDFAENGQYNYGSKFLEFGRKYAAPLMNLWYTKAAFNHLIYHNAQEMLDPGWSARLQTRMQSKHNASYWWSPGPHAPESAPDFSTAIR